MTVSFILNGEDVQAKIRSGDRLVDLLRGRFALHAVRADCRKGSCGKCLVLLDGRLVPSCLVPAFAARDREIVTFEGFSGTEDYRDIAEGFAEAGVEDCGFCGAGRALAAEALLGLHPRPSPEEIAEGMSALSCRCSDPLLVQRGVQAAAERRARRVYQRGH